MLTVSKSQLSQVEYLFSQSAQGNHVLFDIDTLRGVFGSTAGTFKPLSEQEAYAVEPHLERLIQEPSLDQKKAYLEGLDRHTLEQLVRTYFSIVENTIFEESLGAYH